MKTFQLLPGDVLLFRPDNVVGWVTTLKTWHRVGHCEAYIGHGTVVTSKVPHGTRYYSMSNEVRLFKVLRPIEPLDLAAGLRWFDAYPKRPYGWLDLAAFVALPWDGPGEICSAVVTMFLRACGLDPFDGEPARDIAPYSFDLSPAFKDYEIDGDTEVLP